MKMIVFMLVAASNALIIKQKNYLTEQPNIEKQGQQQINQSQNSNESKSQPKSQFDNFPDLKQDNKNFDLDFKNNSLLSENLNDQSLFDQVYKGRGHEIFQKFEDINQNDLCNKKFFNRDRNQTSFKTNIKLGSKDFSLKLSDKLLNLMNSDKFLKDSSALLDKKQVNLVQVKQQNAGISDQNDSQSQPQGIPSSSQTDQKQDLKFQQPECLQSMFGDFNKISMFDQQDNFQKINDSKNAQNDNVKANQSQSVDSNVQTEVQKQAVPKQQKKTELPSTPLTQQESKKIDQPIKQSPLVLKNRGILFQNDDFKNYRKQRKNNFKLKQTNQESTLKLDLEGKQQNDQQTANLDNSQKIEKKINLKLESADQNAKQEISQVQTQAQAQPQREQRAQAQPQREKRAQAIPQVEKQDDKMLLDSNSQSLNLLSNFTDFPKFDFQQTFESKSKINDLSSAVNIEKQKSDLTIEQPAKKSQDSFDSIQQSKNLEVQKQKKQAAQSKLKQDYYLQQSQKQNYEQENCLSRIQKIKQNIKQTEPIIEQKQQPVEIQQNQEQVRDQDFESNIQQKQEIKKAQPIISKNIAQIPVGNFAKQSLKNVEIEQQKKSSSIADQKFYPKQVVDKINDKPLIVKNFDQKDEEVLPQQIIDSQQDSIIDSQKQQAQIIEQKKKKQIAVKSEDKKKSQISQNLQDYIQTYIDPQLDQNKDQNQKILIPLSKAPFNNQWLEFIQQYINSRQQ